MYKLVYTEERPSKKKFHDKLLAFVAFFIYQIILICYILEIRLYPTFITHKNLLNKKTILIKATTFTYKTAPASHEEHTGKQRRVLYI